jgi:hypothetical protein
LFLTHFIFIATFTPNTEQFVLLNSFTRVFVVPPSIKTNEKKFLNGKSCSSSINNFLSFKKEYKSDIDISNYFSTIHWSHNFKIKKLSKHNQCSTLTSVYIKKSILKKLNLPTEDEISKFIVSINFIDSPMTNIKSKDTVKRLMNAIENSYPADYFINKLNNRKIFYAILNILNDENDDNDDFIELSENLLRQYELSRYSRVQVKTVPFSEYSLEGSKKIVVRTSHQNVGIFIFKKNSYYFLL